MWSGIWGNALLIVAAGSALILAAAFGRALGDSTAGRKFLTWSPAVLALVVAAYLGLAFLSKPLLPSAEECIYDKDHPSGAAKQRLSPAAVAVRMG